MRPYMLLLIAIAYDRYTGDDPGWWSTIRATVSVDKTIAFS